MIDLRSHRLPALTHIFIHSSQIDRMQCFHPSYLQMLLPSCDFCSDSDTLHRCGWTLHASNNICLSLFLLVGLRGTPEVHRLPSGHPYHIFSF